MKPNITLNRNTAYDRTEKGFLPIISGSKYYCKADTTNVNRDFCLFLISFGVEMMAVERRD
jgi:hypothetical protein